MIVVFRIFKFVFKAWSRKSKCQCSNCRKVGCRFNVVYLICYFATISRQKWRCAYRRPRKCWYTI